MSVKNENDPTLDKVRDLLFGQQKKETDVRVEQLNLMLERYNKDMLAKISALERKLSDAQTQLQNQDVEILSGIGKSIEELGRTLPEILKRNT